MAEKEYIDKETVLKHFDEVMNNEFCDADFKKAALGFSIYVSRLAAADVAPVKHGHWVKEKSDVLTDTDKWIEQISNMVFNVNPAEIASHIQNGTLKEWCLKWQQEMNMLIITAPLDYSNSKEREENA